MQLLVKTLSKCYCKQRAHILAAAAKMYNNKPPKQMEKKVIECCANTCKPWRKLLKILAKFECDRKNLSKPPRCNFDKNHMAATHTSKRKQCTNNRTQLKLKTYEIRCGYVRSVVLGHSKCCFSFVCDAEGIRAQETTNAHVQVNKVWANHCRNYSARSAQMAAAA